ncbi:Hypothetical predicted protein [Olea europaea subsp. europaea]|uniref:Uncharacterized protein n=1 Tax=Olea europaea subsp. europaea TaxID=158383 RepID=A0A8S0RXJ6_OLEEU|nr:Hypothetical predicted protein [Olea europaea subsp. europaea]
MPSLNFNRAQSCAQILHILHVKNNGMDKSPFITHSTTMYTAIISFLIYAILAYGMNLRSQNLHGNPPPYPFHCMVFFGNTEVASQASIFFPDSVRAFLYVLCVVISGVVDSAPSSVAPPTVLDLPEFTGTVAMADPSPGKGACFYIVLKLGAVAVLSYSITRQKKGGRR